MQEEEDSDGRTAKGRAVHIYFHFAVEDSTLWLGYLWRSRMHSNMCSITQTTRHVDMASLNEPKQTNKQTPWPLVRERTIPTERQPLVVEV
jgi:hypothetical protein